jgi:hypothetical protein
MTNARGSYLACAKRLTALQIDRIDFQNVHTTLVSSTVTRRLYAASALAFHSVTVRLLEGNPPSLPQ